jgi:hypothetical protein
VLRGGVRARGQRGHRPRDGGDGDDVGGRPALEEGQERAQAPDAAEVVHVGHRLDPLGRELEEAAAGRDPRVVHEELDGRVPLADAPRHLVDLRAVTDVADLRFRAELARDPLEALAPPGEQHAAPSVSGEPAREGGPDAARPARDDGDAHVRVRSRRHRAKVRSVVRLISTVSSIGSA